MNSRVKTALARLEAQQFPESLHALEVTPLDVSELMRRGDNPAEQRPVVPDPRSRRRYRSAAAMLVAAAVVVVILAVAAVVIPNSRSSPASPPATTVVVGSTSQSPSPSTEPSPTAQSSPSTETQVVGDDFIETCEAAIVPSAMQQPSTWYTPAKAAQLTAALQAAFPSGTSIDDLNGNGQNLTFTSVLPTGFDPGTNGQITTPIGRGGLMLFVPSGEGPSNCADVPHLVRRLQAPDGTIVDLTDEGERDPIRLRATAYRSDGTHWALDVQDEVLKPFPDQSGGTYSGAPPLTLEQMALIVAAPGLDISTPANG